MNAIATIGPDYDPRYERVEVIAEASLPGFYLCASPLRRGPLTIHFSKLRAMPELAAIDHPQPKDTK